VAGNVSVDGGTIKLDGNYPVGTNNVALGNAAGDAMASGGNNVSVGSSALTTNTSGGDNVAVGSASMANNQSGSYNTSLGRQALAANTTASNNTAVGYQAAYSNTTGTNGTYLGYQAGYTTTGSGFVGVGFKAGFVKSGLDNFASVMVGNEAGVATTSGLDNTFVGGFVARANTTGSYNTALGTAALYANTTASNNTAVGYQAGYSNTTGIDNTHVGMQAGYSNTTSSYNVFIGDHTGYYTTSTRNTFIGHASGESMTTGERNTILGRFSGNIGGLDIRTSSNNIVLSDGDGNPRLHIDSSGKTSIGGAPLSAKLNIKDSGNLIEFDHPSYGDIARIGSTGDNIVFDGTVVSGVTGIRFAYGRWGPRASSAASDNFVDLGSISERFDDLYATNGTIQTSDQNEKQQITALTDAEITAAKAISKLFKTFKWNSAVAKKGDAARTHSGVIAQEVEQAMTDAGLNAGDYAFFISTTWWEADGETYETAEDSPEGATERNRKGIRYPQLLSFIGAATEQRLASIESRLDALENA
jgi:hypothetical protein